MFFRDDNKVKINNAQVSTFVGADTRVEGTIITKTSIRIDGQVVGGVITDETVILSKKGQIQGNVIAENIVVAGVVNGNLQINDKTNIEPSGEVYGDISTGRILIDEESIFQGNCSMNLGRRNAEKKEEKQEEKKQVSQPSANIEKTVVEENKKTEEGDTSPIQEDVTETTSGEEVAASETAATKRKRTSKSNKNLKVEILE